jgi:transposase-like protein
MRSAGTVVAGGVVNGDAAAGLPREEREDRDAVRARMEAKAERRRSSSPFAGLVERGAASESQAKAAAPANEALAEAKFTTPDLVDDVVEPEPEQVVAEPVEEPTPDPSHGRIDEDIREAVEKMAPTSLGQRVAIENTLQDHRDDGRQVLDVEAPKPAPKPRPAAKPVERTARAHPPLDKAGIVREYLEDNRSIPEIAKRRGHSTSTVRRVLVETPGLVLRDDRTTHSGGRNKAADSPEVVEAVRRLYGGEEQLTQEQVAERLDLTPKVVQRIMRDHEIPARPAAHERAADLNRKRATPSELMRQRLEAAGVTSKDVRAWAQEHDLACPATGTVPQRLLAAYLRADGGIPAEPDATDLALHEPVVESAAPPVADEPEPVPEPVPVPVPVPGAMLTADLAHYEGTLRDTAAAFAGLVEVPPFVHEVRPVANPPAVSPVGELLRAAAALLTAAAGVLEGERGPA